MQAKRGLNNWKMDLNHMIAQVRQELDEKALRVKQLGGTDISDDDKLCLLLDGLPGKYEPTIQGIQGDVLTDMNTVIQHLENVENRLRVSSTDDESINQVENRLRGSLDWVKNKDCFNCGEKGHIERFCKKTKMTCATCKRKSHRLKFCQIKKSSDESANEAKDLRFKDYEKSDEIIAYVQEGLDKVEQACHTDECINRATEDPNTR